MVGLKHLRRRLLLGLGAALFTAGAVILSIGLIGYFDDGQASVAEEVVTDLGSQPPTSIDDVPNLPVAIPYYNPRPAVIEPEPEPEPEVPLPVRLVIESIEVDAPVVEMGMDDQGIPYVPLNGEDVAWYNFSSKPGTGSNAVFAGHVVWSGPAVFANLEKLQPGDTVRVTSADGSQYTYEVFASFLVDPDDPESLKVMYPTPTDIITLITCGGSWIPNPSEQFGGSYTNRVIVQARLTDSTLAAPVPAAISEG